jgi:hypothetical protein
LKSLHLILSLSKDEAKISYFFSRLLAVIIELGGGSPINRNIQRKRHPSCIFVIRSCGLSGRDMGGLIRQGGCVANRSS